jgi:hypothetical protein
MFGLKRYHLATLEQPLLGKVAEINLSISIPLE